MNALHEKNENQNLSQETQPAAEVVTPVPQPVALQGQPLNFEEALALTMKKYDNALRELAK